MSLVIYKCRICTVFWYKRRLIKKGSAKTQEQRVPHLSRPKLALRVNCINWDGRDWTVLAHALASSPSTVVTIWPCFSSFLSCASLSVSSSSCTFLFAATDSAFLDHEGSSVIAIKTVTAGLNFFLIMLNSCFWQETSRRL